MGIRDKNGVVVKNTSFNASEHSLPEKLTHALRALRPGALSHSSSGISPFSSKYGVVDADDVVYYANADPADNVAKREKKSAKGRSYANHNNRKQRYSLAKNSPSHSDLRSAPFVYNPEDTPTLEQIRHLYKSVPNVSSCFEDDELSTVGSGQSADDSQVDKSASCSIYQQMLSSTDNLLVSPSLSSIATSQSPTDSGYRSSSRYVVTTEIETKPPSLAQPPPPLNPPPFLAKRNSSPVESILRSPLQRNHRFIRREDKSPKIKISVGDTVSSAVGCENPKPITEGFEFPNSFSPSTEDEKPKSSNSRFPFHESDVIAVLTNSRINRPASVLSPSAATKLVDLVRPPLLRICNEMSRLSKPLIKCTKNDVRFATMLVLPEKIAEECIKAATQATTLYALSGSGAFKRSMQSRAGLDIVVGKYYRWMIDSRIASIITDTAVVYFCAVIQCFLEHVIQIMLHEGKNMRDETIDSLMFPYPDICQFVKVRERRAVKSHDNLPLNTVCAQSEADLRLTLDVIYRHYSGNSSALELNSRRTKNALYFGKPAIATLYYFTHCRGQKCSCQQPSSDGALKISLCDWMRLILCFVDHRFGVHVDQQDVMQAARLLLPNVDFPPYSVEMVILPPLTPAIIMNAKKRRRDTAFALLQTAEVEFFDEAMAMLLPAQLKTIDDFGLTPLAQAVITRNEDAVSLLLANHASVNSYVPLDNTKQAVVLSSEFAGWSSLSWAIANRDLQIIGKLLELGAEVDSKQMIHETPLQLATMTGDIDVFQKLMSYGANAFVSTVDYNSMNCNYRCFGCPCALALAAAYGRKDFISVMLSQSTLSTGNQNELSLPDFLRELNQSPGSPLNARPGSHLAEVSQFKKLPKIMQKAVNEAFYYAVETCQVGLAFDLRQIGIPWNIYTWTKWLESACSSTPTTMINTVLGDFKVSFIDNIVLENAKSFSKILFKVIQLECNRKYSKQLVDNVANIIQTVTTLYKNTSSEIMPACASSTKTVKSLIDSKYADNAELSDVRFKIDDKIVFGHRIILVNVSPVFRQLLEGSANTVELDNVSYNSFKMLMEYSYGNQAHVADALLKSGLLFQLDIMEAALTFEIDSLVDECQQLVRNSINNETCIRIYRFAQQCGVLMLVADCEMYILQNIRILYDQEHVALLFQHSGERNDLCISLANRLYDLFLNSERK